MDNLIYKGDQNVLWDAPIYDYALWRMGADTTFFIVDEKMGTADIRIKNKSSEFMLTSDYCNKNAGAVWVHQDVSSGPFYSTPIEPKRWKRLGVHLKYFDKKYKDAISDFSLEKTLSSLGVSTDNSDFSKALTESENYLGIVPIKYSGRSISSVLLSEELLKKYWTLFVSSYKGALKTTLPEQRKKVMVRARKLLSRFKENFDNNIKTVSDLQELFWRLAWKIFFKTKAPPITRASELFKLKDSLIPHEVFQVVLNHPKEFTECYNTALNLTKLPLKRIHFKNNSMELPFFMECKLGCGTLVRWRIRATFSKSEIKLKLIYPLQDCTKEIIIPSNPTFKDTKSGLLSICPNAILIGKAGPLVSELTRPPRILALPELGSKYAPMVLHLTRELQKKGLDFPDGTILRLGIHSLTALEVLDNSQIILPDFLSCFWGKNQSTNWIASNWKRCSLCAEELLKGMKYHPGQLLTLARYTILEYHEKIPVPLTDKLAKLGDVRGISRPMSNKVAEKLEKLLKIRDNHLSERRNLRNKFENLEELHSVNRAIELVMCGILKRHLQLSQLTHMNRRPFTLSYYLTWGSEILEHMANLAHQRREQC